VWRGEFDPSEFPRDATVRNDGDELVVEWEDGAVPTSRSYWVGLPVGVTVHDDGRVEVEVDMSEASKSMGEQWYEATEDTDPELAAIDEPRYLTDLAIVDAQRGEHQVAVDMPAAWIDGVPVRCQARWRCGFETTDLAEMEAHVRDPEERHGDS
jgi:hypothetical protein